MEENKEDVIDRNIQEPSQKRAATFLTFEKPDNIWKWVHADICQLWRGKWYRTQIANSARSPGDINWSSKVKITLGQSCIIMSWNCFTQLAIHEDIMHETDSLKYIHAMITWRERKRREREREKERDGEKGEGGSDVRLY